MFCNCFVLNYVKIQHIYIYKIKIICHRGYNRIASNKEERTKWRTLVVMAVAKIYALMKVHPHLLLLIHLGMKNIPQVDKRERNVRRTMKYFLQKGT